MNIVAAGKAFSRPCERPKYMIFESLLMMVVDYFDYGTQILALMI